MQEPGEQGSQTSGGCQKVAATHIMPREEPSKQQGSLGWDGKGNNSSQVPETEFRVP